MAPPATQVPTVLQFSFPERHFFKPQDHHHFQTSLKPFLTSFYSMQFREQGSVLLKMYSRLKNIYLPAVNPYSTQMYNLHIFNILYQIEDIKFRKVDITQSKCIKHTCGDWRERKRQQKRSLNKSFINILVLGIQGYLDAWLHKC